MTTFVLVPGAGGEAAVRAPVARELAARGHEAIAGGYPTSLEVDTYFLHDVPPDVLAGGPQGREPADTPFGQPCEFRSWPDVPMHVITAEGDRFFPRAFQERVARDRLGVDSDL